MIWALDGGIMWATMRLEFAGPPSRNRLAFLGRVISKRIYRSAMEDESREFEPADSDQRSGLNRPSQNAEFSRPHYAYGRTKVT